MFGGVIWLRWVALFGLLGLGTPAYAQSTSAQAEALFRQGRDLMAAGKYPEACTAFEGSQKLDANVSTQLNLAACRQKNGQLATAWGLLVDVERNTRNASDATTKTLHQTAKDLAKKIEPHIPKLTIVVAPERRIEGLEILRDGAVVDATTWNHALPVDGGTYKIEARAPNMAAWSSTVTVAASDDAKTVDVPKLQPIAVVEPKPVPDVPPPVTPTPVLDAPRGEPLVIVEQPSKALPIAVGIGALALGAGGLAFELSAQSTYDESKVEVDDAKQESLWNSANTQRHVAQVMAGAGVVGVGIAVWLYVRSTSSTTTVARGAANVAPMWSSDRFGLQLSVRY